MNKLSCYSYLRHLSRRPRNIRRNIPNMNGFPVAGIGQLHIA